MKREVYFETLKQITVDAGLISEIQEVYGCKLPHDIQCIVSAHKTEAFIEGERFCRILTSSEILNASAELHVDFAKYNIIPFFDVEDNNFVVFDFQKKCWKKFNIVDEVSYGERTSLNEII